MKEKSKVLSIFSMFFVIVFLMSSCTGTTGPSATKTATQSGQPTEAGPTPTIAKVQSPAVTERQENVKMIISKNSGKALAQDDGKGALVPYSFLTEQTWYVEQSGDAVKLKNMYTSKYLEDKDNVAVTSDAGQADTQKWRIATDEAGFSTLTNVGTGKILSVDESNNLSIGAASDSKRDYWRLMDVYLKDVAHSDASWLEGGYGVMTHVLPDASNRNTLANSYDAEAIAAQLEEVGASYLILTVGQGSGYWNTPNKIFSSMVSYGSKSRYTKEDIITKMGTALKKHGIKLIVYAMATPPAAVSSDMTDFCFNYNAQSGIAPLNMENALLWSMVLQDWSDTYGDLVAGWWIDGCYTQAAFNSSIASLYANALKHGNSKSIVAFNKGGYIGPYVNAEDFTGGETSFPLDVDEDSVSDKSLWLLPEAGEAPRFSTGVQWFELTYIGETWLNSRLRYTPDIWADYVYEVVKNKGAIALDAGYSISNGCVFSGDILKTFKAIGTKLGKVK